MASERSGAKDVDRKNLASFAHASMMQAKGRAFGQTPR
jgi:hypothetical protein